MIASWQESYDKHRQCVEKRRHYSTNKSLWHSQWSHVVVRAGLYRRQSAKKLIPWNSGAGGLLRFPWTAKRSNQSILRKINPEYSLGGLMLKLKPQYFGYLMWTVDSLEKSLVLGNIEGRERRGHQRMSWLDGITEAMGMNLGKLWETVRNREAGMLQSMGSQIQTRLGDWTKTIKDSVLVLKMHFLLFLLCYSKRNYIIKLILCSFGRGF